MTAMFSMRLLHRVLALTLLLLAMNALPVLAAPPKPAQLSAQDRADMTRIEQYLNDIHSLSGHFDQFAQDGATAAGKVFVARPGRMRFEYDAPSPILIVADGTFVVYIDNGLKQVSYLPIGSTPAWFLLRDKISLSDGITVTRFERGPGVLRLTVVENKAPENGTLTLTMSDRPLELKQWSIVDEQGKTTTVVLSDLRSGVSLDPNLFTFVDPRPKRGAPQR